MVLATALCFVVASPALLDLVAVEFVGLVVVAAQTTPLIAALIFFALRRPGRFRDVFALGWGRSWPVLGIGLAVVVGAAVVQLGVGLWLGWELRAGEMIASAAVAVLPLLVVQSVFAIGEEWGWRGWLATRMERLGFWVAAAIGAAAWVVWHLPAVPLIVGDATWEFGAAYLLGIASWTPLMLWLRWASGSVWPAVVVHGAINSLRCSSCSRWLIPAVASTGSWKPSAGRFGWEQRGCWRGGGPAGDTWAADNREATKELLVDFLGAPADAISSEQEFVEVFSGEQVVALSEEGTISTWLEGLNEEFVKADKAPEVVDPATYWLSEEYASA